MQTPVLPQGAPKPLLHDRRHTRGSSRPTSRHSRSAAAAATPARSREDVRSSHSAGGGEQCSPCSESSSVGMQRSEYSLTPASESSSVGMQRSEPSLTPRQVESLKQSSDTPQSRCGLGCCATHLDGVPGSAASESSSVGMQRSEPSLTPRQVESLKQSSDTPQPGCGLTSTATPSVMVTAGEPMVIGVLRFKVCSPKLVDILEEERVAVHH